jgi:hypothetical protein
MGQLFQHGSSAPHALQSIAADGFDQVMFHEDDLRACSIASSPNEVMRIALSAIVSNLPGYSLAEARGISPHDLVHHTKARWKWLAAPGSSSAGTGRYYGRTAITSISTKAPFEELWKALDQTHGL